MERRKTALIAQTIQTTVNATFLLLAAILIYDRWDNNNNDSSISAAKKEMNDAMFSNVVYLEEKVNRVAGTSDAYQNAVSSRIYVLERRMDSLETRSKSSSRVINTNTTTVTK
ncbi:hypothetical protein [Pseudomonas phage vB_PsaM_M1]|nr:hypothetical protein [Pseudomonas phage vB_PsaM_M1]